MSTASTPHLSIVIAASNGPHYLRRCLNSLKKQIQSHDAEVLVIANFAAEPVKSAVGPHEAIRFISHPESTTVPELRTRGLREAEGNILALSEDNIVFDADWCAAIEQAHELPHSIIGGPVAPSEEGRAQDWAVYFYEYGRYMPPTSAGPVDTLAGNNVSYKREVLTSVWDTIEEGFFETFVHQELQRRGHTLYLTPTAQVNHIKQYAIGETLRQCFHHGRSFAGLRTKETSMGRRLAFIAGSLTLPILLPARIIFATLRKRRHVGDLARALPYLFGFMTSWSAGEFCGYAFGPGDSIEHWN